MDLTSSEGIWEPEGLREPEGFQVLSLLVLVLVLVWVLVRQRASRHFSPVLLAPSEEVLVSHVLVNQRLAP